MNSLFSSILFFCSFIVYTQIAQVQQISTDIVSSEDYENLMRYSSKFYKDQYHNFLYLDGLTGDGAELHFLDNSLNLKKSVKLKDLAKNIVPIKIKATKTHTYLLFHSHKTFYVSVLDNETELISNFEFKSGIKNKYVVKYLANANSFTIAYKEKKDNEHLHFWVFDFEKKSQSQNSVKLENTDYEQALYDQEENTVVLLRSKNNTTILSIINLDDFYFNELKLGVSELSDSKTQFKSKIYKRKLIQAIKYRNRIKLIVFDNYLDNETFTIYDVNEDNVDFYTRKNDFTKKNVKSISAFCYNTNDSVGLELTPFMVNNSVALVIDVIGLAYHNNMSMPGNTGIGMVTTTSEYSIGYIKTAVIGNKLFKYVGLTPDETLTEINKKVDGDLILQTNFEFNEKYYFTYYDMNSKNLIISEYFR